MSYAASLSTTPDTMQAVSETCRGIERQLAGRIPDLLFVFASSHHGPNISRGLAEIRKLTQAKNILGCSGEFIAGTTEEGAEEIENRPALSLWAAALPGAMLTTFHATFEASPEGPISMGLPENESSAESRALFFLGDPYTTAIDSVLSHVADEFPATPLMGGMASGGRGPNENFLFLNDQVLRQGGVGVVIQGGPRILSVVSQGCRPVGPPLVVTRAERNVLLELGGKSPMEKFQEIYGTLPERDQALVREGVHLGLAMDETHGTLEAGDFLIANVMGADQETGALAITNLLRAGQTVRFHVRDAQTADEELIHLLQQRREAVPAAAALLFSCNGRGTRLFPVKNHDVKAIGQIFGDIPVAGFFAQGELGPVGRGNYIHGFTASIALFESGAP
ncbi:MAG: FIST N-terminal domain-containing protein [Planctomycetales bacterium]